MSHGEHWEAIHPTEQKSFEELEKLLEMGTLYKDPHGTFRIGDYSYLQSTERPLGAVAVIRTEDTSHTMVAAYPAPYDLADNELEIYSVDSVSDEDLRDTEGVIRTITRDGTEISFFCPCFLFFKQQFECNRRFRFGLGAIVYLLEPAPKEITLTNGAFFESEKKRRSEEDPDLDPANFKSVTLGMESLRTFFEKGDGNFEFQSVVEEIVPFESLGTSGVVLLVNLVSDDRDPIRVKLYAATKALGGYSPRVGDLVRGVAWLHGVPKEVIEAEDSWMDSSEAAHGEAQLDTMIALVSFMWNNPQLPIAVQAVGGAFAATGWAFQCVEQTHFCRCLPSLWVERNDERYAVFVRSSIRGFCEAEPYEKESKAQWTREAAKYGAKCLFVTVHLESLGRTFSISSEGLEELSQELSLPFEACRPEEFKVVKIDEPGEGPDPVFNESAAIETYALCLNTENLADFSKLLVEDLDFSSDTANTHIRGRQQILSHIGSLLHAWKKEGSDISVRPAKIEYEARERPCAVLFRDGKPFACTILTGRRAHVAGIRNLPHEIVDSFQSFGDKPE